MQEIRTDFYNNLQTVEETSFFIKNFESYLNGNVTLESMYKSYSFLKNKDLDSVKSLFPKLRTELISRKKVKIYTAITVSRGLIGLIYSTLKKYSKTEIVLEPLLDLTIVAGIKFSLDGKIHNLTLEKINSAKSI